MKIIITMEIDPEYADEGHDMGVTEDGCNGLNDALSPFGTEIEVRRELP